MNRQIKFRAWDKGWKEIVYPDIINHNINLGAKVLKAFSEKRGLYYPLQENIVLLQFTGLTDKNGKEVYCGDIVKSDWGYSGVVDFESIIYAKIECTISDNIEVVGNIYENKELL